MSKSIKFKDNTYLDSSSIVHGTTKLDAKLDATDTAVVNAQNTATSGLNKANNNATQIDNVIKRIGGYGDQALNISDPDNLGTGTGFYRYYGNFGGKLGTSWWFIIHMGHYDVNGNYCRQLIFNYWGTQAHTRIQSGGTWGNIKTFIE